MCETCSHQQLCLLCMNSNRHVGHKITGDAVCLADQLRVMLQTVDSDMTELSRKVDVETKNTAIIQAELETFKRRICEYIDLNVIGPTLSRQRALLARLDLASARLSQNYLALKSQLSDLAAELQRMITSHDHDISLLKPRLRSRQIELSLLHRSKASVMCSALDTNFFWEMHRLTEGLKEQLRMAQKDPCGNAYKDPGKTILVFDDRLLRIHSIPAGTTSTVKVPWLWDSNVPGNTYARAAGLIYICGHNLNFYSLDLKIREPTMVTRADLLVPKQGFRLVSLIGE